MLSGLTPLRKRYNFSRSFKIKLKTLTKQKVLTIQMNCTHFFKRFPYVHIDVGSFAPVRCHTCMESSREESKPWMLPTSVNLVVRICEEKKGGKIGAVYQKMPSTGDLSWFKRKVIHRK